MKKENNVAPQGKHLSLFAFFALTASMSVAIYEYPTFASSGFSLVFYLLLAAILWFIPVALSSAEMATVKGWDKGGVYTWSGNMLGEKWGFANVFFQWFQCTVSAVTMIYFLLGALSYVLKWDALNTTPWIKYVFVLIVYWGLTFLQFRGTRLTSLVTRVGFTSGAIVPAIILIAMLVAYFSTGGKSLIKLDAQSLVPSFSQISTLVVFVSFVLSYAGSEASAPHAIEMKNVKKNYPLAIIMLIIMAIILNTVNGMSIASVVPEKEISLSLGVIQGFEALSGHFGAALSWMPGLIGILIIIGICAEVSSWIVGPSWGMQYAGKFGLLAKPLTETNKHGVPTKFLMMQAAIVSGWAALLTFGGGGGNNISFFTAISLTAVIYLAGYVIMLVSYIKLVRKYDDLERGFRISKGKPVRLILAFAGLAVSVFALAISFVPPSQLAGSVKPEGYIAMLAGSFVLVMIAPFILYRIARKKRPLPKGKKMPGAENQYSYDDAPESPGKPIG